MLSSNDGITTESIVNRKAVYCCLDHVSAVGRVSKTLVLVWRTFCRFLEGAWNLLGETYFGPIAAGAQFTCTRHILARVNTDNMKDRHRQLHMTSTRASCLAETNATITHHHRLSML
ncbi:unnamed protein product [Periconia digitata]|uniref:Uncharacterized protein n=1 Tax=Periconia digitata TaxID=1303443 RepID=A0A9W4U6X5_9PLEO|nr:unnamed protein product [Periconia digitata]